MVHSLLDFDECTVSAMRLSMISILVCSIRVCLIILIWLFFKVVFRGGNCRECLSSFRGEYREVEFIFNLLFFEEALW